MTKGPTFMRMKSSIKIRMTITIKLVPLISDLCLSTRLLYGATF